MANKTGDANLTEKDVLHIARLARIEIKEADVAKTAEEMQSIVSWMSTLAGINVDGVEPTYHAVPMNVTFREDIEAPRVHRNEYLAGAPKTDAGAFAVPKVMEGE